MFGRRAPRAAAHGGLLLLLAAFAVALLAGVPATMATGASPPSLVDGLRRDLGAVRAQLERAAPDPLETSRQTVAFNTDLGDGGPAFRRRTMATMLRSARRHLEHLAAGYRNAGDVQRAKIAEHAQVELHELAQRVQDLGNATHATGIMWARKRSEAETLLDRLQERLATLLPARDGRSAPDLG